MESPERQVLPPDEKRDELRGKTLLLKEHGCALIEAVGDLGQLRHKRFEAWVLPLKMRGLDACPVRLLAIEDDDEAEARHGG